MIDSGRLPISFANIELIAHPSGEFNEAAIKKIINDKSSVADLTVMGFRGEVFNEEDPSIFKEYDSLGNVLFVNSIKAKSFV